MIEAQTRLPVSNANLWLMKLAQNWTVVALAVVFLFFAVSSPDFLSRDNWVATSVYMTGILLLAVGQTYVIVSGGIDLSVGGTVSAAGMIGALAMQSLGGANLPVGLVIGFGVLAGIVVGILVGAINGLAVSRLALAPFIVTLGMMGVTMGVANLVNNGQQVAEIPTAYSSFGGKVLGGWMPSLVLVCAVVTVVAAVALAKTRFGMRTYALGSNPEAARRAGINVTQQTITIYAISGAMAGLTGVLMFGRFGVAQTNAGQGTELLAIAAVVIGGASLFGGKGTVLGSVIGVAIMSMLVTGLVLIGVQPFWQTVITGLVIIGAVYIDQQRDRLQMRLVGRIRTGESSSQDSPKESSVASEARH